MRGWIVRVVGVLVVLLCVSLRGAVAQAAFSPDSTTLATVNAKHAIELWDVANGTLRKTLTAHEASPMGLAFPSGGQSLVSWSRDGEVILWDASSGRLKQWLLREKIPNTGFRFCLRVTSYPELRRSVNRSFADLGS